MTMIEQVARAIAIGTAHDPDVQVLDEGPMWKQFVPAARAAIAAMREPTDQMMATTAVVSQYILRHCWQGMVDAALGEK